MNYKVITNTTKKTNLASKPFLIIILTLISASVYAQTPCFIKYTYDAAGNRIHREFVCEEDHTPDEPENPDAGGGTTTSGGNETMLAQGQDTILTSTYTLVYPNPNSGDFWVEFKDNNSDEITNRKIYILDIEGKLIMELSTTDKKQKIELTHVSAGNYFVAINDGQKTESHKVTIIK